MTEQVSVTIEKDLFEETYTVRVGAMEQTFDTQEEVLAFISKEMTHHLR